MKKSALLASAIASLLLVSCNTNNFTIEGTVNDADSTMLYLENATLSPAVVVDSAMLTANGDFRFSHPVPEAPAFYRLRIGSNVVNMVVDTAITITYKGSAPTFATAYELSGSDDCEVMRQVSLAGVRLKEQVNSLFANTEGDDFDARRQVVADSLTRYKEEMTRLVMQAPSSPVAYYILMQQVNGQPVFDTFDPADNRIIAAAATSHDIQAPNEPRTRYLHDLALQGMAALRANRPDTTAIDTRSIPRTNYIDIARYDLAGNERRLSDVAKQNRVVLLDFTAYQAEYAPDYNMVLGTIYQKFHNRGLEIYQVSFDTDDHLWNVSANNLPWVCVRDKDNLHSQLLSLYNIQSLPTCFIIVDNGEQLIRPNGTDDLQKQLIKILGR